MTLVAAIVLVGVSATLVLVLVGLWWLRRSSITSMALSNLGRRLVPRRIRARAPAPAWVPERTLYETYERLGVARAEEPGDEERTAHLRPEQLGFGTSAELDQAAQRFELWRHAVQEPRNLEHLARGPELAWIESLRQLQDLELPIDELVAALHQGSAARRTVAGLALLAREDVDGLGLLRDVLVVTPPAAQRGVLDALILWRSKDADQRLSWMTQHEFERGAVGWGRVLVVRGRPVDPDLIERFVFSDEPALVTLGLELSSLVSSERRYGGICACHLYDPDLGLRAAAIEGGLRERQEQAWAACLDWMREPDGVSARALVGLLGAEPEQRVLADWSRTGAAPTDVIWALALSGRAPALELAFGLERSPIVEQAILHITGERELRQLPERGPRWLVGEPYSMSAIRRCVTGLPGLHARALRVELGVRMAGAPRLPLDGYASEILEVLARLEGWGVDFESGFPWRSEVLW